MNTQIIPLGTGSAVPAHGRHLSATALWREGRVLLFDCGEGAQLRLLDAGLNRARVDAVFITHFHGDHFFGIFGLLSTMGLLERTEALTVVGPEGLQHLLHALPGLNAEWLPFPIVYVELEEGFTHQVVLDTPDFFVEARPIEHRVFTVGYRFQEKPRPGSLDVEKARALGMSDYEDYRRVKQGEAVTLAGGRVVQPEEVVGPPKPGASFAYVTDTRPCDGGARLARDVDLVYHEATFGSAHEANAVETAHSTAREAAGIALEAGAKRLLLGHFSARYADAAPLVTEARHTFKNTEAAEELRRYELRPRAPESSD